MENKKNRKPLIALLLVAIVGLVGGTIAYFTDSTTFSNVFKTLTYGTTVTEEFVSPDDWTPGTETSKTVVAKNTGDVDVAVRVSYKETWTDADGKTNTLSGDITVKDGNKTKTERAAVINFDNTADWTYSDGYYYYKKALAKDETSSSFIKSVTFNPNVGGSEEDVTCTTKLYDKDGNKTTDESKVAKKEVSCVDATGYAGATYTLDITVETIQYDAYQTEWTDAVTIAEAE